MPSLGSGVTRLVWGRIRARLLLKHPIPRAQTGAPTQADVKDGLSEIMLIKISVNYHGKEMDPGLNTTLQES